MRREQFQELLAQKVVILDGATGTQMQQRGMPKGVCPEKWAVDNREILRQAQKEYRQAGSDAVYTFSFGANRIKLAEYGLGDEVVQLNRQLAKICREAVGVDGLVVGDLSSTGRFVKPFGDLAFEEAVQVFKEQVAGLLLGGVDFFVIETMIDIQEARAALLAVKESCDLPVCVSMSFQEDGRTLTGTDPITAVITLQSLGADAVGCNCSTGPEAMLQVIAAMADYAKVPLLAKPNAGMPRLIEGETVFDMAAPDFGSFVTKFYDLGIGLLGGCCGTTPNYIAEIKKKLPPQKPKLGPKEAYSAVTSARQTVFVGKKEPLAIVGERINPTGKKKLQEELRVGKMLEVRRFAQEQTANEAVILDVNVGMPGIDEQATMVKVVELLATVNEAPLCIDSSSPEVIEAALRIYPGRALLNSISAEKVKLEKMLPIAAKYGAMFVLLPLDDQGVPERAQERFRLIEEIFGAAAPMGYQKEDIVVDGLVMTVSSSQEAALETLKVIDWCSNTFGMGTILGLSNVSFGLPERGWLNSAFLAMAAGRGLTMAIANPGTELLMNLKMAADVLMAKDRHSQKYISYFTAKKQENIGLPVATKETPTLTVLEEIFQAVLKGNKEIVGDLIKTALSEGKAAPEIVDGYLIPAITEVGSLYDRKEYFLPQLIQSAETMKQAFEIVEPLLVGESKEKPVEKAAIVLATVKGDVHDIGKNIVGLMLKNYGFRLYDLGKDVAAADIIRKVKETKAQIVGLSALMTTTMVEMKEVIDLAKQEGLNCKFMIGGAVVSPEYATEIGADGYAADAYAAVKLAQELAG